MRAAGARRPPSTTRQPGSVGVSGHDLPRSLLRFGGNFIDYLVRRKGEYKNTPKFTNFLLGFSGSVAGDFVYVVNMVSVCHLVVLIVLWILLS